MHMSAGEGSAGPTPLTAASPTPSRGISEPCAPGLPEVRGCLNRSPEADLPSSGSRSQTAAPRGYVAAISEPSQRWSPTGLPARLAGPSPNRPEGSAGGALRRAGPWASTGDAVQRLKIGPLPRANSLEPRHRRRLRGRLSADTVHVGVGGLRLLPTRIARLPCEENRSTGFRFLQTRAFTRRIGLSRPCRAAGLPEWVVTAAGKLSLVANGPQQSAQAIVTPSRCDRRSC
jgi:hypothetical protein